MISRLFALCVSLLFCCPLATGSSAPKLKPLQVFILAGQSNMEGQAVADLDGKGYNDGKGTLKALLANPRGANLAVHLQAKEGSWAVRNSVWVRYQRENAPLLKGPLSLGYSVYGDTHHFGPELQFGNVIADNIPEQALIIKTAWGGKSLYKDFRPPSSGGTVGPYYLKMIEEVRTALANLKRDFPAYEGQGYELSGFVWYQGWNDGVDPQHALLEYEQNLVNLIKDVRKDLKAPKLPVVIGELTGPWVQAPPEWTALRHAQAAAAARPEFQRTVVFIETHDFVRPAAESPNPGHGHHEFGNAETCFLVGDALGKGMISLMPGIKPHPDVTGASLPRAAAGLIAGQDEFLAGYLIIPTAEKVERTYNAGFSMYVAAWPLLRKYPGHRFQTGLPGTWMFAQYDGAAPKEMYSDVEGGLGWWTDTRFATETPKFIMGGVAPNFSDIANGPAHGWGTWEKPQGLYGVAQISPWLLFPIDGLNLKQGTCGELFGYGYLTLPLSEAKATTNGKAVPTGGQCWTLFLSANNFKGPVAFFTPNFWSHAGLKDPRLAGQLLDSRPVDPNRQVQMETQYIPCRQAMDSKGESYARIAPTSFPRGADGSSALIHQDTAYDKKALWNSVEAWFAGGAPSTGAVDPQGVHTRTFSGGGHATWEIRSGSSDKTQKKVPIAWNDFATPTAIDPKTFGYRWNYANATKTTTKDGRLVTLPEYFHLENGDDAKRAKWVPIASEKVPAETGLQLLKWDRPVEKSEEAYATPDDPKSSWKKPGPAAGPFKVHLGDGSVVTYYWYRFADQPALLNADLTDAERERMQARVEKLHRAWPKNRDYLAPPTIGKLADIDPALIVKPPKGLEVGYVPIAARQELEKR